LIGAPLREAAVECGLDVLDALDVLDEHPDRIAATAARLATVTVADLRHICLTSSLTWF
jgi:hypothetical protein